MKEKERDEYILGTGYDELHRLGLQHQVWSLEARKAWDQAGFSYGDTILDMGCGPGFCSMELAYLVGPEGKVIGVDKSWYFLDFLEEQSRLHKLGIETVHSDFHDLKIEENSLDGVYSRWALAWSDRPAEVIGNIAEAMKPGAAFVAHEYNDWSTLSTEPEMPALSNAIGQAFRSLKEQAGDIDIGRRLPELFYDAGLEVISIRPMSKMGGPGDLNWFWPKTFFKNYFPRLVEYGFLKEEESQQALEEHDELETMPGAMIFCPHMVELIAVKI